MIESIPLTDLTDLSLSILSDLFQLDHRGSDQGIKRARELAIQLHCDLDALERGDAVDPQPLDNSLRDLEALLERLRGADEARHLGATRRRAAYLRTQLALDPDARRSPPDRDDYSAVPWASCSETAPQSLEEISI